MITVLAILVTLVIGLVAGGLLMLAFVNACMRSALRL